MPKYFHDSDYYADQNANEGGVLLEFSDCGKCGKYFPSNPFFITFLEHFKQNMKQRKRSLRHLKAWSHKGEQKGHKEVGRLSKSKGCVQTKVGQSKLATMLEKKLLLVRWLRAEH